MFHFDGYTRGNHPDDAKKATDRRPVRFFHTERMELFNDLFNTLGRMAAYKELDRHEQIKHDLYDVLMSAAGALAEINDSDRSTT